MAQTGPFAWYAPDAFVGKPGFLSAFEPYQLITGSAMSSLGPASAAVIHWNQPAPVVFKNVVMEHSYAAGPPAATSQASTGSEAFSYAISAFIFSRQDYSANSSNLSMVVSGSFGLSAAMGYSQTSQTMGFSWVTDTAGGTSNLSTTSNDAGWSNYLNGPRVVPVPMSTVLPSGEYWMIIQHSSTSATSNSNITMLSVSHRQALFQQGGAVNGLLGQSTTNSTVAGANLDIGMLTATPTTSTTMPISAINLAANRQVWFALSNV